MAIARKPNSKPKPAIDEAAADAFIAGAAKPDAAPIAVEADEAGAPQVGQHRSSGGVEQDVAGEVAVDELRGPEVGVVTGRGQAGEQVPAPCLATKDLFRSSA